MLFHVSTLPEKFIVLRDLQYAKASDSIDCILLNIATVVSAEHSLNAQDEMTLTILGIVTYLRDEQPTNAL